MPTMVKPKATRSLCPTATPGRRGLAGADHVPARARRGGRGSAGWGGSRARWGSLASSGLPVAESVPSTTQLLLPSRRARSAGAAPAAWGGPRTFSSTPWASCRDGRGWRRRGRGGEAFTSSSVSSQPSSRPTIEREHLQEAVARHAEGRQAVEADLGRPRLGAEAGELELDGQPVAARHDEDVDPAHEGLDDLPPVRGVARVLGLQVPAVAQQPGEAVAVARPRGPSTSASRPSPIRRQTSICQSRSWAATNPWAKKRSSWVSA